MLIRRHLRAVSNLTDTHGRIHDYLRISLTERCNLRCNYCMPLEGVDLTPQSQLLTAKEIQQISSILVKKRNLTKIRLTGGEPLIRKDILEIISGFNELREHGLAQIGITTNGVAFTSRRASRLAAAGLDTANISLDTLEPMKAEFITRRPKEYHKAVLASIDHSLAAGITTKNPNHIENYLE